MEVRVVSFCEIIILAEKPLQSVRQEKTRKIFLPFKENVDLHFIFLRFAGTVKRQIQPQANS